jgi:hypothetical protein
MGEGWGGGEMLARNEISKRLLGALLCYAVLPAAAGGKFVGKVIVEWLDDKSGHQAMRLVEDFAYEDAAGQVWLAPKQQVIDGSSIPPIFRSLVGPPFSGGYRQAAVVHEAQSAARSEQWRHVRRMFYDASLANGIAEPDAKVMYMALYAEAPRWEPRSSSCFNHCHAAASALVWRPVVAENELRPIVEWIDQANPTLDEIDEKVNAVTRKPGPHLFVQGHEPMGGKP